MADQKTGDGLLRWLIGGVVAGAIVLGLLIGAYAIGYHRGTDKGRHQAARAAPAETAPATSAQPAPSGEHLWASDGCAGCHSLDGSAGAGPTVKGLAGSTVTLDDGSTVTANDAYLAEAITDPDAKIVKGYGSGVMSAGVKRLGLDANPQAVDALVAFVKAQR